MKKVIIITALPFRKQGNQSMIRFTNMFLKKGMKVTLLTSGTDKRGENVNVEFNFKLERINWLPGDKCYSLIKRIFNPLKSIQRKGEKSTVNYFSLLKSEDQIPPFGLHNTITMINKWLRYLLILLDNFLLIVYLLLFRRKAFATTDLVVGYEVVYTTTAKVLAKLFGKPYVNKFQGVILKASNRNTQVCRLYYPDFYFGINVANLCIMVNDGTDGEFYAKHRGNKNVLFIPHGINIEDYASTKDAIPQVLDKFNIPNDKFIVFNNASNTTWKRSDRSVRFLSLLSEETKKNVLVVTTYHAENVNELRDYCQIHNISESVVFIEKADHKDCNALIQHSKVLLMTNDLSNLGNPVLESIYYGTPVISINDGSLDGFIESNKDGILIDLNEKFDQKLAEYIEKMYKDPAYYDSFKQQLTGNNTVKTLDEQQSVEFDAIKKVIHS